LGLTLDKIAKQCIDRVSPDGTAYKSLSLDAIEAISLSEEKSLSEITRAALENNIIPERYTRNMQTLTVEDQTRLLSSRACVVGLGGLGGQVVEILARIGIGHMTLIDGDVFEESNLNRQLLSQKTLLGTPKANAAKQRVSDLNDGISITSHALFLTADNANSLISNSQVVVDCLDNLKTRFVLEQACRQAKIPLVSAAIAGLSGQVTVVFPEDSGLTQIYGAADSAPDKGAEATLGTLPNTATIMAALEATEVIKILLGKGALLRNKLMIVDLMDHVFEVIQL
jgi:molybdopterin/thiamine biosynthesis adenylyltransferase